MEIYSKGVDFTDDFPIQPIHPDKAIKEGDCPICRGDGIVKVFENGVQHYASCICNKHNEQVGKERKEQEINKKSEEIQWQPFHSNAPIKEGDCPI